MIAVVLALASACAYGISDFVGGVASAKLPPWVVAFGGQCTAAILVLVAAAVDGFALSGPSIAWAVVAGIGNGLGTVFLYRGLSKGRMGIVAPLSGVFAALVPVLLAVGLGERPGYLVWLGIIAAAPAIWLVASAPDPGPTDLDDRTQSSAVLDGVLAGLGFGLTFAGVSQIDEGDGLLPLALNQIVAASVIIVAATLAGARFRPTLRELPAPLACGLLGATALVLFLVSTQHGLIAVTAVIASLYPAATVLLAALALGERIHRSQAVGLALCVAAVSLVAAG
ncbi:MAG: EamA family transporter [Nocardioides sp.]